MGGWLEDWRAMLNSTQDQIKLKLKFELSLAINKHTHKKIIKTKLGLQRQTPLLSLDPYPISLIPNPYSLFPSTVPLKKCR